MLGALANISWLAAGQLEKVADALTVTRYEKRSTIFSDKSPSESAYILLAELPALHAKIARVGEGW
jgi:signal-transduction protein with cAMP-binding, CBS, and nucleotidyltransferase domain